VNTIFLVWIDGGAGTGYVELPYTLPQDSTLFLLLEHSSIHTWTEKLDWVVKHGGLALVIVHPDYVNFDGYSRSCEYSAHLYQGFLEFVRKRYHQEAWFALPKDVALHVQRMRSSWLVPTLESISSLEPLPLRR
jgi:hypothetical protein